MPLTGEDSNGFAALSSLPESRSRSSSIDLPLFERTTSPCSSSSARALEASLGVRPATSLSSAALSTSGCATRVTKAACALEDSGPPGGTSGALSMSLQRPRREEGLHARNDERHALHDERFSLPRV